MCLCLRARALVCFFLSAKTGVLDVNTAGQDDKSEASSSSNAVSLKLLALATLIKAIPLMKKTSTFSLVDTPLTSSSIKRKCLAALAMGLRRALCCYRYVNAELPSSCVW